MYKIQSSVRHGGGFRRPFLPRLQIINLIFDTSWGRLPPPVSPATSNYEFNLRYVMGAASAARFSRDFNIWGLIFFCIWALQKPRPSGQRKLAAFSCPYTAKKFCIAGFNSYAAV